MVIEIISVGVCSICGKKVTAHTDPKRLINGSPVLTGYVHDDGSDLCQNELGFVRINGRDLLKLGS